MTLAEGDKVTLADVESQIQACYLDWQLLLANPRFCRNDTTVAWNKYSGGIIRDPINYEKVRSLIEEKQYSFQCAEDGSVFQLVYEFDRGNKVRTVRLAFYQAHLPLDEDDLLASGPRPDFADTFIPWLRFDYTQEYAAGVLHHESHMHLSGFPASRFAVSGVPGPRQFVEFVIASCYPDYYKMQRLDKHGRYVNHRTMKKVNVCCLHDKSKGLVDRIIHVKIP